MLLDMGSTPIYSTLHGAIVQLGERLHGMQEVVGSSPISSKAKKWLKFLCWKGFQPFIFMCEGESSGYTFMWNPV